MRACGHCSRPVKKIGPPVLHGVFLDQVISCERCGWTGVETTIIDPEKYKAEPVQLKLI